MRRLVLTMFLATMVVMFAAAQDYNTGLGLRFGTGAGITVKHFLNKTGAIEGLLMTRWQGFDITGLYEKHGMAFDTDRLQWYYGGGAHLGFYNGNNVEWGEPGSTYSVFGIDGIIGIEYSFTEAPINLGLDFKPALSLIGYTGLWAEFGLSARYIF